MHFRTFAVHGVSVAVSVGEELGEQPLLPPGPGESRDMHSAVSCAHSSVLLPVHTSETSSCPAEGATERSSTHSLILV